ncbi:MAG: type I-E CRISPR-associated protein Cas6/Cse3/CasE, partial [Chloroflexi bacterium]|nr:type I-E CRISPR-associated protein Cas6/Cse3/CasE [Chloroflexota bacterium]
DGDAAGVLFRVDPSPRDQRITVLVQSQVAPVWSFLVDKRDARGHAYLLPASLGGDGKPNPATTEFDLSKKTCVGQALVFRLRANPTKRLGAHVRDQNGKRVGIYEEAEQLKWLQRKAEAGGFRIVRATVSRDERIENKEAIPHDGQQHDLKLLSVRFDGVLQVIDVASLCKSVARGIGSGKGFGFGLLSLAPA